MKLRATDHEHLSPVGHRLVAELLAEKILALEPVNPYALQRGSVARVDKRRGRRCFRCDRETTEEDGVKRH